MHTALSERQVSILMPIAEGNATTAIARVMAISPETVRSHIKEIFRRLDVRGRAHAVSVGYRTGILDHRALDETAGARS